MTTTAIPVVHASLGEAELEAVARVFASGWPAGQGPEGGALENELRHALGAAEAVALSSCGAALHMALSALGVGAGDEVIVADYTFPAPAHAVRYVGATPVFADVLPETGTVDPAAVESLIGPRTVGVIAVDTLGLPADYAELGRLTDQNGLFLVEDAACALGATYQGQPAGRLAPVACLSFHGRKGISYGEGGALLTQDADLGARARRRSSFGIGSIFEQSSVIGLPIPDFEEAGYNYKLSDIAAAIVRVQLTRISELHARRAEVARAYDALLADVDGVRGPTVPTDRTHAWQSYLLTVDDDVDRAELAADLRSAGIGCGHGAWATHLQSMYRGGEACPASAELFRRSLTLPMHAELTSQDVTRVVAALREALDTQARARRAVGGGAR